MTRCESHKAEMIGEHIVYPPHPPLTPLVLPHPPPRTCPPLPSRALPSSHSLPLLCALQAVIVWNLETGEMERVLEGHAGFVNGVSFSSDGRLLLRCVTALSSSVGKHFFLLFSFSLDCRCFGI